MIRKRPRCGRGTALDSAESNLQPRQLSARVVRILDNFNSAVARNRRTDFVGVSAQHNYKSWNDVEHRRCNLLDKSLPVDLEERLRISHPVRLARREDNPFEPNRHCLLRGLLRTFEAAETHAKSELVASLGAALTDYFGDYRDRDLLGRFTANHNSERRMAV